MLIPHGASVYLVFMHLHVFIRSSQEGDILARWTFDEGNGSVATDVAGGGLDLLLEGGAKWGLESNNTAISKYSRYSRR